MGSADDGPGDDVERLRDELASARAEIAELEHRLSDVGSLSLHLTRTTRIALRRADARIRSALDRRPPVRPPVVAPPADGSLGGLLEAAAAADRRTVADLAQGRPTPALDRWETTAGRWSRTLEEGARRVIQRLRRR